MLFVPDDSIFFFVPQETKRMEHKIKERKAASPPALPRREGAGVPNKFPFDGYLNSIEWDNLNIPKRIWNSLFIIRVFGIPVIDTFSHSGPLSTGEGGGRGHPYFFVLAIFFLISVALSAPESIAFCQ